MAVAVSSVAGTLLRVDGIKLRDLTQNRDIENRLQILFLLDADIHQELQRQYRIEKISEEIGCTDAGYFDFLARKNNIDLEDRDAVMEFASGLAKNSPGCFQARITPGSSAVLPENYRSEAPADANFTAPDRISRIMDSLNSANAADL